MKTQKKMVLTTLALLTTLAACSDSGNVLGPSNDLQLVNQSGTFEWQATSLENVKQTLTYTWANPGTVANVNQSTSLSSGSATLTVADASGTQVYTTNLTQNGSFQTTAGQSGNWTVTVELDGATGHVNFRLETP